MTTISIIEEYTDYIVHEPSGLCCQLVKGNNVCPAKNLHQELEPDQKMLEQKKSIELGDSPYVHDSQKVVQSSHVLG